MSTPRMRVGRALPRREGRGERDGRDPEQERQRLLRYFGAAPCKTEAIRQRKLFAVEHYFDLIESGEADKGAQERKELCRFVLQSSCVAADYLEAFVGFSRHDRRGDLRFRPAA